MIINKNGIKLNIERRDNELQIKILEQSEEFTRKLRRLEQVQDHETNLILRSNKHPSFNKTLNKLFVRGTETDKNNKTVKIPVESAAQAETYKEAVSRLIDKVQERRTDSAQRLRFHPGGTAALRMQFINRELAIKLGLTSHDNYPLETLQWVRAEPAVVGNLHADQHLGQAIGVLNKALGDGREEETNIINPHFVTTQQARDAIQILKDAFGNSKNKGCEVAFWRLVSGTRTADTLTD